MTRTTVVAVAVGTGLAALAISLAAAEQRAALSRVVILAIGVIPAAWLLRRFAPLIRSTPERFEADLRQPFAASADIAGLRALDNTLRLALGSSFGVEFLLKPLLRELAGWRLMRNRGIDLAATPDLAQQAVGEPLRSLIGPGEPRRDYSAPGMSLLEIQAGIEELERI